MNARRGCTILAALAAGNMVVAPALAQSSATYTYDALGRLVTVTYPSGAYIAYTYDKADNRTLLVMSLSPNHPPTAANDTATVAAGATIDVAVLGNDQDSDQDPLTITQVTGATLGAATRIEGDTKIRYVANAGPGGTDVLTYTISDGRNGTAQATLTITVTASQPPVVANKTLTVQSGSSASVDAAPTSGAWTSLQFVTGADPAKGSAVFNGSNITYTANAGAASQLTDTLSYRAVGPGGTSNTATVTVTINPVVPPPAVIDRSATVNSGSSVPINTAPTGNWTSVQLVTPPNGTKGTATVSGSTITYTANSGIASQQTDTFTYRAVGPGGNSNTSTITITINPAPPTVTNQSATVTSGSSVPINVSPGGVWTLVQLVTQPSKGSASVSGSTINYTANGGLATTTDSFNFRAIGPGGASNTGTITVTINAALVPPVVSDKFPIVGSGASVGVDLTPSGAWTSVQIVTPPNGTKGTASLSGTTATYTANSGFFTQQNDTFTYRAFGPGGTSSTATVYVTINPQIAPPTVSDRSGTVTSGQQVIIPLSPNGNWSSVQIVTPPNGTKGSAVVSGGDAIYTANSGILSQTTDTFTFNASGAGGTSNTATVTVTINPAQSQLMVQASPLTFYRLKSGTSWGPATPVSATVVSGGSGSYSYEWIRASGDASTIVSSPTNPQTAWTRSGGVGNGSWVSYWYCRITDLVTGQVENTGQVQVTIEFDSGA